VAPPGLDGETVGVGVVAGLYVKVGRGVGVDGSGVAGCDGDGCARDRVADGTGAGGAALLLAVAVALVVGCASMGAPPAGPVLPGSAALVAAPGDWLAWPDLADAAEDAGGCPPVSAMAATIPVAAIAITTPATAAVIPDSASIRRRGGLTGSGKPLGRNGPARCVTSRR
jgi:hypothetical protein